MDMQAGMVVSTWYESESIHYPDPPPMVAEALVVKDNTTEKFNLGVRFDGEKWRLEARHDHWPLDHGLWDKLGVALNQGRPAPLSLIGAN